MPKSVQEIIVEISEAIENGVRTFSVSRLPRYCSQCSNTLCFQTLCAIQNNIPLICTPLCLKNLTFYWALSYWPPTKGVVYNFSPVCMSVCQTMTLERMGVENSFMQIRYSREYGSSSYMKVIGSRSWSLAKKVKNSYSCTVKLQSAITPVL